MVDHARLTLTPFEFVLPGHSEWSTMRDLP